MKMKFRIIGSLAIAAVSTVLLGSCESDPDSAGLEYMPDMYRSPAVEPYVDYGHIRENENVNAKMRLSAMTPAYHRKANSSFRETHGMFGEDLTSENTYLLAAEDKNPMALPTGEEALKNFFSGAKTLFNNNCSHCHGESGDGNGKMMVNETYAGVPDYANLTELSDGQMFYSIYYGKGSMGSHRSIINKKEIWTLVHYIRSLQNSDYGVDGNTDMGVGSVEGDSLSVVAGETPN